MKKFFVLLSVLLLAGFAGSSFAQLSLSGDLQVRGRDDIKDYGDYGTEATGMHSNDFYYMLRAGINVNADIGDGFFGKVRLEHYNYAGYIYTAGSGMDAPGLAPTIAGSNDIIARPTVNFTQLYLGVNRDNWGIEAGIFPISGLANPILDIHYLPYKMIDIPFTLYRLNTLVGVSGYFKAGPGKINYFISNDFNGNDAEDVNGVDLMHNNDAYTIGADYDFKLSDFGIQPIVLFSIASDSVMAPVSYGINLSTPVFSGFNFGFDAALSNQSVDGTAKYDAQLFRIIAGYKPGFGSIEAWFDIAKRTDKAFTTGGMDVDHNFTYLWLLYKIPVYNSDHGALTIIPRVRRITEKVDNAVDFQRFKIELLFAMSFK